MQMITVECPNCLSKNIMGKYGGHYWFSCEAYRIAPQFKGFCIHCGKTLNVPLDTQQAAEETDAAEGTDGQGNVADNTNDNVEDNADEPNESDDSEPEETAQPAG